MKFTTLFAIVAATAAIPVFAVPAETNASRMARGLPPLPPVRRATSVQGAKRGAPSITPPPPPTQCQTGPVQCCQKVALNSDPTVGLIIQLLGIVVPPNTLCGLTCSPVNGVFCPATPVCCKNNSFNGIIAINCTPATL